MQISLLSRGRDAFKPNQVKVQTVIDDHLANNICEWSWSPIIFDEGYRHGDNFKYADVAVFDVDNDGSSTLSLDEAQEFFKDYEHVIATSRSHQVEKNGKVTDRYRVLIAFNERITDPNRYSAVMLSLRKKWSFIDPKCIDLARFFFPCSKIVSVNDEGVRIGVEEEYDGVQEEVELYKVPKNMVSNQKKDQLTRPTLKFLLEGAEPGQWHSSFFKAVSNMKECGYDEVEIREKLEIMCSNIGSPGLDDHDERNLYSIMRRPVSEKAKEFYQKWDEHHSAQQEVGDAPATERPLITYPSDGYQDLKDYVSDTRKSIGDPTGLPGLDRLLGGGFRPGELTVLLANAKSGKNTLYHYLVWNLLKTQTKQGYASREIDPFTEVLPNLLSLEFKHNVWTVPKTPELLDTYKERLSTWSPLMFTPGYGYIPVDQLEDWIKQCYDLGARLFWLDHLHYMLAEPEEPKEASKLVRRIKALTKQLNIHINLIVQPTKATEFNRHLSLNSLRGGASIGQALDNLLILERYGETDEKNISRLKLEVGRHKLTKPGEIFLRYDPNDCSFQEMEREVKEIAQPYDHQVEPVSVERYHQVKNLYPKN